MYLGLASAPRSRPLWSSFTALAASAAASTKWADLRVVTHTGRTLAEFRQYTGSTTVRSSTKGDCFGSPSTNKRYTMGDANALGIVKDALESDHALSPLVLTDAFVDDGFGLGVCTIGGFTTVGVQLLGPRRQPRRPRRPGRA